MLNHAIAKSEKSIALAMLMFFHQWALRPNHF
jgi:hypothetical protein